MKKTALLFLLTLILMVPSANAGTEQGAKEVQLQGSFVNSTNSENDDKTTTSTGQLTFNYFLTNWFSLGGTARISGSRTDYEDENRDDTKSSTTFWLLRGDFYLGGPTSTVVPYIGAQAGIANYSSESGGNKNSSSTSAYGGHGGLRIFPSENVSWNLELDVTSYKPDVDEGQEEVTYTDTSFLLGFSYYF
jgi:opacity protein-like surface antigen